MSASPKDPKAAKAQKPVAQSTPTGTEAGTRSETISQGPGPREARSRALELLYQRHFLNIEAQELLDSLPVKPDSLAVRALLGVNAAVAEIDAHINESSTGWKTDRMPAVDREILRLGVWELLERDDVSVSVIINEAVELAKDYSTESSPGFVNGVLDTIASHIRADHVKQSTESDSEVETEVEISFQEDDPEPQITSEHGEQQSLLTQVGSEMLG